MDSRPEVTIAPAGDLTAQEFLDIQVDAGGAPEVRILVDGRPFGGTYPTGQVIHVDLKPLAEGEHELVARVEQGSSPRSSERRRLVRPITPTPLPIEWTETTDPWSPFTVTFTSQIPMVEARLSVTGQSAEPVPFVEEIAVDRRRVVVSLGATLAELGLVKVRLEASGPAGERSDVTFQGRMPNPIPIAVQVRPTRNIDLLFTPGVPVPGATAVVFDSAGNEMVLGEIGPSPWEVRLPEGSLGSGTRYFEFRRADARIATAYVAFDLPPGFLACTLDTVPSTLAPGRCGRVTNPVPLRSLHVPGSNNGWTTFTQVSETEWRLCVTEMGWRSRMVPVTARLEAVSTSGFPFLVPYEPKSCLFPVAWDWKDPGADSVTDGSGPILGELVAVRATTPDAIRIAYVGAVGTADPGGIHVAARASGAGVFDPGPAVNIAPVAGPAVALGGTSAVAWRLVSSGVVEGLLQDVVGPSWTPWPVPTGAGQGTETPAIARDASGPTAVAWAERLVDGTTQVRVRAAATGWTDLPVVAPLTHGNPIRSVALASPTPLGAGIVVAFVEEDLFAGRQYLRLVSWSGSSWDGVGLENPLGSFFPHDAMQVRVSLAGSATSLHLFLAVPPYPPQIWRWEAARGSVLRGVGNGNGSTDELHAAGAPSDGRDAVVAWVARGTGASREIWVGPVSGTGATSTLIATVKAGGVATLALDADGMSVAWTEADGTIHVRTLTP
jgi:hypothetical protein